MDYPNEYIITELMHKLGFSREQAEKTLASYDSRGETDVLIEAINAKNEACSRL